jgi:hypothetical protein
LKKKKMNPLALLLKKNGPPPHPSISFPLSPYPSPIAVWEKFNYCD